MNVYVRGQHGSLGAKLNWIAMHKLGLYKCYFKKTWFIDSEIREIVTL
jgi:hypothetical protein